jgi:hypothetical protein
LWPPPLDPPLEPWEKSLWPPPLEPPEEPPLEPCEPNESADAEPVTARVKARAPKDAPAKVDQRELFILKSSRVAIRDL